MAFDLASLSFGILEKKAINEVISCNDFTQNYGLSLTQEQARELVRTCGEELRKNDRVEFGGGITQRLIKTFCDSPYLMKSNYDSTLHDLISLFYYYKTEMHDKVSDETLLYIMKKYFDEYGGSIEMLVDVALDRMSLDLRSGASETDLLKKEYRPVDEPDKYKKDEEEDGEQ